ncbi:hypothetical protein POM88_043653 [Heracleum sosnowskyi]|uniref:GED domain-containing protein n=1 Tax=Heracleum sosnowskyi TaxID=360622 RepID=A0AAD8M4G7_9APIA|nr:hypothetical protein POM88_043653 [Heracleum sosnowskyi]
MSHRCMVNELQRFPILRKRMDEVIGNFLREGLEPSETMIGHIVEMEPPTVLRPSDTNSEQKAVEIIVTKKLLRSYYDIVRKNIEDFVPKSIMHFLAVELALQEMKSLRAAASTIARHKTLDELPVDADAVERGYSLNADPTGLPRIHGLPPSSFYSTSSGSTESYTASPKNPRSRKSSHSGELYSSHITADSNGGGRNSFLGLYPTVEI